MEALTESLRLVCRGQEDVVIAGQLARKALKPKGLTLVGSDADSSFIAAVLATEQHHPMFQRVQWLALEGSLPKDLPQVSETCLLRDSGCHAVNLRWLDEHACNHAAGVVGSETSVLPKPHQCRMCSCPCPC
jgi:hypothetical protein